MIHGRLGRTRENWDGTWKMQCERNVPLKSDDLTVNAVSTRSRSKQGESWMFIKHCLSIGMVLARKRYDGSTRHIREHKNLSAISHSNGIIMDNPKWRAVTKLIIMVASVYRQVQNCSFVHKKSTWCISVAIQVNFCFILHEVAAVYSKLTQNLFFVQFVNLSISKWYSTSQCK